MAPIGINVPQLTAFKTPWIWKIKPISQKGFTNRENQTNPDRKTYVSLLQNGILRRRGGSSKQIEFRSGCSVFFGERMGRWRATDHGTNLPDLINGLHVGGEPNRCENGELVVDISRCKIRNREAQGALLQGRTRGIDAGSVSMRESRGIPVSDESLRSKHGEALWVNGPWNPLIGRGGRAPEGHSQGAVQWIVAPMEESIEHWMIHTGCEHFIRCKPIVASANLSGRRPAGTEEEGQNREEQAPEFHFHGWTLFQFLLWIQGGRRRRRKWVFIGINSNENSVNLWILFGLWNTLFLLGRHLRERDKAKPLKRLTNSNGLHRYNAYRPT